MHVIQSPGLQFTTNTPPRSPLQTIPITVVPRAPPDTLPIDAISNTASRFEKPSSTINSGVGGGSLASLFQQYKVVRGSDPILNGAIVADDLRAVRFGAVFSDPGTVASLRKVF